MHISLLPDIILQQADRNPSREAFKFQEEVLSYGELADRMRQLAAVLVANGLRPGDRVGLYLHKSLESIIGAYGAMLAGGVYVPLDPAMPLVRLREIITDGGIRHLVTHHLKKRAVASLTSNPIDLDCIIGLDDGVSGSRTEISWESVARTPAESFEAPPNTEQDLAYIIYTSGSTGVPKGIMHTHYSGLSFARLACKTYALKQDDRLANFAPLHFDQSTFELFAGPLAGATTVIIPEPYMKLPASLSQLAADEKVTIWYSVPFALIQLLLRGLLQERDLSTLRWVLYGGEPFPPKYLYALMALWPHARFSNIYGPAEVNQCMYYHVPFPPDDPEAPIPIGWIWENTRGLIVDQTGEPVEAGEPGELLIRSPTMMAGYWNRPDLNEKAFYRRQVLPGFETLYYRTGDLVLERENGLLEFLGRMDRQVKSRGFRVELDEVEAVLTRHPAIQEAAVYSFPDQEGSQQIEAAVIARSPDEALPTALNRYLRQSLPAYAIPQTIHFREQFPRTTSGKIDRRDLQKQGLVTRATN